MQEDPDDGNGDSGMEKDRYIVREKGQEFLLQVERLS